MDEENLIFDGEIHIADDKTCYILEKILTMCDNEGTIDRLKNKFINKYIDYLNKYEKDRAVEFLLDYILGSKGTGIQFVHCTAQQRGMLCQYSTLALKFPRSYNHKEKIMDIDKIFTYHKADHIDQVRFEEIREAAKKLGRTIIKYGGSQEDKERAILKLRESVFYAIASIAIPE